MHIPDKWNMGSTDKIHQFITEFGFAALISNNLEASHIPLLLSNKEGEFGVLYGHFARSNPHWKSIRNTEVLAIFTGPHSYISPTWYEAQPSVPTWNYSAVHVVGSIQLTDDETTLKTLEATIEKYEPSLLENGGFIPEEYRAKLSKGIVGFKIIISKLQGKEKLGQHRSSNDQIGVTSALEKSSNIDEQQLYKYMQRNKVGIGS